MNPQQYPYQPGPNGQPGQMPPSYPQPGQPQGAYPPQGPGVYPPAGYGPPQQPYPPVNGMAGPANPMGPPPQQNPMMGYNPYPYPGEYGKPPGKGPNKAIVIGGVVLLLVIAIIGALSLSSSGGNGGQQTPPQTEQESTKTAKDVEPRDDNRLDLSSKVTLNKSLKAQKLKGNISEQLNLSSGFSFMATKLESYLPTNEAIKPAANKKLIAITTIVGNRLDGSNLSVSYLDFRLRNQNNVAIAPHGPATNEILNNPLSNPSELKPGEQLTGKIVFEVDMTDTSWVFVHSETYQKTTDDTTFTVEGEIVLSAPSNNTTTPPSAPVPAPSRT